MLATVLSHAGQGLKTQSNGGQSWTRTRRIARPPAAAKDPLGKGQRGVRAAPRRPARPASKR
jgi:hypothetical protein